MAIGPSSLAQACGNTMLPSFSSMFATAPASTMDAGFGLVKAREEIFGEAAFDRPFMQVGWEVFQPEVAFG